MSDSFIYFTRNSIRPNLSSRVAVEVNVLFLHRIDIPLFLRRCSSRGVWARENALAKVHSRSLNFSIFSVPCGNILPIDAQTWCNSRNSVAPDNVLHVKLSLCPASYLYTHTVAPRLDIISVGGRPSCNFRALPCPDTDHFEIFILYIYTRIGPEIKRPFDSYSACNFRDFIDPVCRSLYFKIFNMSQYIQIFRARA